MTDELDDFGPAPTPISTWRSNHGNVLLAVMAGIFVVGAMIIAERQINSQRAGLPGDPAAQNERRPPIEQGERIRILVSGVSGREGKVLIAIYDSSANFNDPSKAIIKDSANVESESVEFTFPKSALPPKFAVAAFHDQDGNGVLSKYISGFPKEKYGFSNSARGLTGPPSYEQARIECPEGSGTILVSIK